jgi:hypothetical protein
MTYHSAGDTVDAAANVILFVVFLVIFSLPEAADWQGDHTFLSAISHYLVWLLDAVFSQPPWTCHMLNQNASKVTCFGS